MSQIQQKDILGHPRPLAYLFFAEMWERFSFYGMRALLVLYLTESLFLGVTEVKNIAYGIFAAYGALVYATPFIGGVLADKLLGYKKATIIGAVFMAIGHFVMAVETEWFLYIALAFLIIGNGFFKPNISSMVGGLYPQGDSRRDSGFTIFYMGINLGAATSSALCGYIGEVYGWQWGFSLAGFGMLLGLLVFMLGKDSLGKNGDPPDMERLKRKVFAGVSLEYWVYVLSFFAIAFIVLLVKYYEVMSYILLPFALGILIFIFIQALRSEKIVRERLFVVLILLFFTTLFWAFFEQAGSSITTFTFDHVNRIVGGIEIKTSIFQSVNPTLIIILGPLFASMWIALAKRKREPSTPVKFSLGILQLGLGFLLFVYGAQYLVIQDQKVLIPLVFLVGGYFLHTSGELSLSPVGLSMVTKLAPKKIAAMVMGAWFLSSALAHHIGGFIATQTIAKALPGRIVGDFALQSEYLESKAGLSYTTLLNFDQFVGYLDVFKVIAIVAFIAGLFLLFLVPFLRRMMHGIH